MNKEIIVEENYNGIRIDSFLSECIEGDLSRSYIQKLIKDGLVTVNGRSVKSNYKINTDDNIICVIPEPEELAVEPENIPLDIVYEDNDLLVVNKPRGMVVHPAAGHYQGTLVNALMHHCKESLSGINGILRPGIVHRIDKDTSGLLIVCKNDTSHKSIAEQLKEHTINRRYRAIVCGNLKESSGSVDAAIARSKNDRKKMAVDLINGKRAVTHYKVLESFKDYDYIECKLETGRTHQIRVHMSYIHHPLLGDNVYGSKKGSSLITGQALHAMMIGFVHPRTGEYMEFSSELPEYFSELLKKLR